MRKLIDLRKADFAQPFCGEIFKYAHVWKNYHIDNAKRLRLKGLSLFLYKLSMPLTAYFKNPCTENYNVN